MPYARILDTRLTAHNNSDVTYVVEEGAQNTLYVPQPSTSHSNQSTTWNLNNIADFTARDPRLTVDVTAVVTISFSNSSNAAINAIQSDNFGARQFCYNRAISNISHKINQATTTMQTSQILDAIARVNMMSEHCDFYDNTQPDNIDSFAAATGTNLSPLASPTSSIQGVGVFKPRTLNYTVSGNSIAANSSGTVTITIKIHEPLISPFTNIGDKNGEALYAINGEFITVNYVTDLWNNMFNYVLPAGLSYVGTPNVNIASETKAVLNCVYLTAYQHTLANIPKSSVYHYNDYSSYFPNDITLSNVAPGVSISSATSQVVNFSQIPQKILIYARQPNRDASKPDIYLTINSLQCSFDNGQPVLGGASTDVLYEISKRNGLTTERASFAGKVLNPSLVAGGASPINGCGSVLVLDPALDLGLRENETNGSPGRFVFQVTNANLQNKTSQTLIGATLYVVGITNGILQRAESQYTNFLLSVPHDVLSESRLLSPVSKEVYDAERFNNLFLSGGGIGDWFKKALSFGKSALSKGTQFLQQNPELVKKGLAIANQYLGQGGALRRVRGKVGSGFMDPHPKKNMDLYFE